MTTKTDNRHPRSGNQETEAMREQQAKGYDIPAVEDWIRENVEGLTPPFHWARLEGGHSNLTYQLQDASGARAVIRRPPQGALLPKAHDMSREWSLISALGARQCRCRRPSVFAKVRLLLAPGFM
jgi:aminoglycoside phosphotransferase (APT) family kinase protein